MSRNAYISLAAVCFAVLYAAGWTIFRPRIEADLRQRTQAAVSAKISSLERVEFAGRDGEVTLDVAQDSADVAQAKAAAEKVWGVRATEVQGHARPPVAESLRIERNGETLRVSGRLVDEARRTALLKAMEPHFGAMVVDSVEVETVATQASDITRQVVPFLPLLRSTAPQGALDFADRRLVLTGIVPTAAARQDLETRARALPAQGFELEVALTVAIAEPAPQPKTLASATRQALESTRPLFLFNSAELTAPSRAEIAVVLEAFKQQPDLQLRIVGHTDARGSRTYNQALSERRAAALAELLKAQGVSPEALSIQGRGEAAPRESNRSESGRAKNRRVEFEVRGGS